MKIDKSIFWIGIIVVVIMFFYQIFYLNISYINWWDLWFNFRSINWHFDELFYVRFHWWWWVTNYFAWYNIIVDWIPYIVNILTNSYFFANISLHFLVFVLSYIIIYEISRHYKLNQINSVFIAFIYILWIRYFNTFSFTAQNIFFWLLAIPLVFYLLLQIFSTSNWTIKKIFFLMLFFLISIFCFRNLQILIFIIFLLLAFVVYFRRFYSIFFIFFVWVATWFVSLFSLYKDSNTLINSNINKQYQKWAEDTRYKYVPISRFLIFFPQIENSITNSSVKEVVKWLFFNNTIETFFWWYPIFYIPILFFIISLFYRRNIYVVLLIIALLTIQIYWYIMPKYFNFYPISLIFIIFRDPHTTFSTFLRFLIILNAIYFVKNNKNNLIFFYILYIIYILFSLFNFFNLRYNLYSLTNSDNCNYDIIFKESKMISSYVPLNSNLLILPVTSHPYWYFENSCWYAWPDMRNRIYDQWLFDKSFSTMMSDDYNQIIYSINSFTNLKYFINKYRLNWLIFRKDINNKNNYLKLIDSPNIVNFKKINLNLQTDLYITRYIYSVISLNNNIINFSKINPTKYRIKISWITWYTDLSFLQSFHNERKLFPDKSDKLSENCQITQKYNSYTESGIYITGMTHTVLEWETLYTIAKNYNSGNRRRESDYIYDINNLSWATVTPWQILIIQPETHPEMIQTATGNITECLQSGYTFFQWEELWYLWKKPLRDEWHTMVYDYANGRDISLTWLTWSQILAQWLQEWWIRPHTDWSYQVDLVLYFRPQSWFYLWLMISGTTLIGLLSRLLYGWVRDRRKNVLSSNREMGE
jgi:hypothetical protein